MFICSSPEVFRSLLNWNSARKGGLPRHRLKNNIGVLLDGARELKVNIGGIGITIPYH
jgi:hypothetical protein